MMEYKKRKGAGPGGAGPGAPPPLDTPRPPQRPQQLLEQGPPIRHSVSAGPELLRLEKRPRSASSSSCHSVPLRDAQAQIQAWTGMVLALLQQVLLLSDPCFLALQPALWPGLVQLSVHVTDAAVRRALHAWLSRVGRLYDISA
ncbi:brefeldin A-inhibited guanine nucleotide-exchange protein 3-like [Menidia menidia]